MAYQPFDPNKPLQPSSSATGGQPAPAPQTSGSSSGYVPFNPIQGQQKPPPLDQGAAPAGWGVNWRTGDVTMPQPVQDWGTVAGNEASMNLLGLRAQAEAARQRLGPTAAASADVAGNILSPTTLLNAVPYVGPELAGATHEGIKSIAAGNDWKTVGEDTAAGAATGLLGRGSAALAPKVLPKLAEEGTKGGLTYLTHNLAGGLAGGDVMKEGLGLLGVYAGLNKVGKFAGDLTEKLAGSPVTRQAIQNLILGGGSATRTALGPWDQWIPGP